MNRKEIALIKKREKQIVICFIAFVIFLIYFLISFWTLDKLHTLISGGLIIISITLMAIYSIALNVIYEKIIKREL